MTIYKDAEVEFVNIHADDIIEGNEKITLGLIWTILHHFQVSRRDFGEIHGLIYRSIH